MIDIVVDMLAFVNFIGNATKNVKVRCKICTCKGNNTGGCDNG